MSMKYGGRWRRKLAGREMDAVLSATDDVLLEHVRVTARPDQMLLTFMATDKKIAPPLELTVSDDLVPISDAHLIDASELRRAGRDTTAKVADRDRRTLLFAVSLLGSGVACIGGVTALVVAVGVATAVTAGLLLASLATVSVGMLKVGQYLSERRLRGLLFGTAIAILWTIILGGFTVAAHRSDPISDAAPYFVYLPRGDWGPSRAHSVDWGPNSVHVSSDASAPTVVDHHQPSPKTPPISSASLSVGIPFYSNMHNLNKSAQSLLELTVTRLVPEGHNVDLVGYTADHRNLGGSHDLSQERAEAVRAWLIAHGITAARLVTTYTLRSSRIDFIVIVAPRQ